MVAAGAQIAQKVNLTPFLPPHQTPVFGIDTQGSAGGNASPF